MTEAALKTLTQKTMDGTRLAPRMWAIVLAILLCTASLCGAQDFRATIEGSVRDDSGAIIPKASVDAVNTQTKETFHAVSNDAGTYSLSLLPIGDYSVRVNQNGFKTEVRPITLHGGDRAQLDFSLAIGSVTETISVAAVAPLLEVTSGESGQTISETQVHDLPLLGRNPFTLALLASGVTIPPGQDPATALRPFDNGGMDSFQVNGGRSYTTDYSIDGLTDTAVDTGSPANLAFVPSPDMTAEFRVATSGYDAEYGRSGGGFISVNLKSGTNTFHGEAYDYIRNELFNANDYEDNLNGNRRSKFRWEQPGIEIDGPLILPKLYNGRDKTFFMAGWEQIHILSPAPTYLSVPTALERQGDFSQSLNGGPLTIYDPLTTRPNGSGGYSRTAFGDQIPSSRIDPVAKAVLAYVPLPNLPGAGGTQNLFASPNDSKDTYNAYSYRLDHVFGPAHRIFVSYLQSNRHQVQGLEDFPAQSSPGYSHFRTNHGAHVDWTWILSPTMTSNLRAGWIEHRFFLGAEDPNFPISTLGFPSSMVASIYAPDLFPQISPAGYSTFGNPGFGTGLINASDNYDVRETILKALARHNLSFGGEIRPMRDDRQIFASNTTFSFGKDFTQANPQASDSVSGNSFASFLLGYPDGGAASTAPKPMYRYDYYALFIQDNWRVNSRLTLTAGLRWDTETPLVDQHHQENVGFDPNATYTFAGQLLHGVLQYPGHGRNSAYNLDLNNFGPRVSFAYSATSRLAVRGGAGVIYAPTFDTPSQTGFSASTPYVASNDNLLTPANTFSNPFPQAFIQPTGASTNINGQGGWSYWPNHERQIPRTTQFSLGFEYSPSAQTVLEVKYVGQLTNNISNARNVNFISTANLALGNALNNQITNPFAGSLPGTFLDSPTYSLEQSLLPYPQYGSFSENVNNLSTSYNGLQVRLEKRLSHGFSALLAYTFSKNMQNGYLNDQDTSTTSYVDPNVVPQVLNIAATYHLPFFAASRHTILKETLGGWQANLIYTASSGVIYAAPTGVQATGVNPRIPNPTRQHEFNTCTLTTTGVRQNCAATDQVAWLITPPFTLNRTEPYFGGLTYGAPQNVNLSLVKSFALYKRFNLEFRAESFNLTNTPQFGAPDTGVNSPTFGQLTNLSQINDPRNIQLALKLSF